MFQYTLVKTITIYTKVFSAFSDPIKDTNCRFLKFKLQTQYSISILLGEKMLHLTKSYVGLYTAFSQILKVPSNIYKINPHKLLESIVETI